MYRVKATCGDPQVKSDAITGVQVEPVWTKDDWDVKSTQVLKADEETVVTVRILEAKDP